MPPPTKSAGAEPMAQTTVRFPRALLRRARIRAATDELTLQALLSVALDAELSRRDKADARRAIQRSGRGPTAVR